LGKEKPKPERNKGRERKEMAAKAAPSLSKAELTAIEEALHVGRRGGEEVGGEGGGGGGGFQAKKAARDAFFKATSPVPPLLFLLSLTFSHFSFSDFNNISCTLL